MPAKWDGANGAGVLWKAEIAGEGHSSPIVFGKRVFVTSAMLDSQERVLFCLDRDTGRELWRRVVVKAALEHKHAENSYALARRRRTGSRCS